MKILKCYKFNLRNPFELLEEKSKKQEKERTCGD